MRSVAFYLGLALQLIGFTFVGLCLYTGLSQGDYKKTELVQFLLGSISFYLGHFLKMSWSNHK